MNRRHALTTLLSALLWPPSLLGQQQRMPVIGVLVTHPPLTNPIFGYLRAGLLKFGYVDGKNIKLEARTAHGHLERVPGLASELVRLRPAAIMVVNEVAVRAVMKATSAIPIVMVGYVVNDPVSSKLIESIRREITAGADRRLTRHSASDHLCLPRGSAARIRSLLRGIRWFPVEPVRQFADGPRT